jgi:hypothetical protein
VNPKQLKNHLHLFDRHFQDERLFVVTPDVERPAVIESIADRRITWLSFVAISQAIDEVLTDPLEMVSEQTRFLLRELQSLFAHDGLIDQQTDVVIVAAGQAYQVYLDHDQPHRSFRAGVSRMAFYKDGFIKREVPKILAR